MPDEHVHEHATCFNLKDRGLIVISSCGHVGIVNSVRQAQEVSGVQKVHAIMGGFHLGPAPSEYLNQVVADIKKLEPDAVILGGRQCRVMPIARHRCGHRKSPSVPLLSSWTC